MGDDSEAREGLKDLNDFERITQTIREVAKRGEASQTAYTDDQICIRQFDGITVTVNDSFSYVQNDMGQWYGVEIQYVDPSGNHSLDRLTVREGGIEPQVTMGGEPRRSATEDDLREFASFLSHVNHVIDEEEHEKQRKQDKEQLTHAVRALADAALKHHLAAAELNNQKMKLASDGAKLASGINGLSKDQIVEILTQSRKGDIHRSPYQAAIAADAVLQAVEDILMPDSTTQV